MKILRVSCIIGQIVLAIGVVALVLVDHFKFKNEIKDLQKCYVELFPLYIWILEIEEFQKKLQTATISNNNKIDELSTILEDNIKMLEKLEYLLKIEMQTIKRHDSILDNFEQECNNLIKRNYIICHLQEDIFNLSKNYQDIRKQISDLDRKIYLSKRK